MSDWWPWVVWAESLPGWYSEHELRILYWWTLILLVVIYRYTTKLQQSSRTLRYVTKRNVRHMENLTRSSQWTMINMLSPVPMHEDADLTLRTVNIGPECFRHQDCLADACDKVRMRASRLSAAMAIGRSQREISQMAFMQLMIITGSLFWMNPITTHTPHAVFTVCRALVQREFRLLGSNNGNRCKSMHGLIHEAREELSTEMADCDLQRFLEDAFILEAFTHFHGWTIANSNGQQVPELTTENIDLLATGISNLPIEERERLMIQLNAGLPEPVVPEPETPDRATRGPLNRGRRKLDL